MFLGITLVQALLCLFVYQCNGTPPKQVAGKSSTRNNKYTDEEDQFIIDELSSLLDDNTHAYSKKVWDTIRERHSEKFKADTPGFFRARSTDGLRNHFRDGLMFNLPHANVKVPEILAGKVNKAMECRGQEAKENKQWYSEQENELIFQELLKPSCFSMTITRALEPICEKLGRKRHERTPGFENERNSAGLRLHLLRMKRKGKLPPKVTEKFQKLQKDTNLADTTGTSEGTSTAQNQQTNAQDDDIYEDILKYPICNIDLNENE